MIEKKLYVITRRDLPVAVGAVMAMHVVADFVHHCLDEVSNDAWTSFGPPITFMTVRNKGRLERLANKYQAWKYVDPDLNDGVCAVCIYAEHWNDAWARLAQVDGEFTA